MALEYKDCFPITNSATFYDPGTDNAHGDSKNGGRDTHTGRLYYNNESVCATPWRNEVIRLREVLDGKIDPRRMAEGEIGLVVKNGVAVVALSQDVGGLEVPQYSRSVDKRGIPHSDIDLSRKLVSQLPGMKVVGDGLEGKDGIAVYSLGMVTSSAGLSQKSPEQIKKLKDDLTKIEQEVAQYGRVPIYRPEEQKFGRGFDANGRRLSFTDNEAKAFWAKYENIRSEIYPKPTITQLDAAQKLVEKVNNKEADISELKSVLGQVYSPEMLQDKRISQIDTSSIKAGAEKELTPGGAYTAYNPKDIKQSPTKEQVESTLTAGMERQQSGESGSEYDSRKRNYMADMLAMLSPEQRLIVAVLAVIFGLIDPEGMGQMMASFQGEDNNRGYGNGYTNSDVGADRARYNDKGVLGGRVEGLEVAQGRALQLLKFDSSKYKNVGEYFAANAKKFEGVSEQGGNNCGPMVKWVMANAGHSEGQPWCAGFSSKITQPPRLTLPNKALQPNPTVLDFQKLMISNLAIPWFSHAMVVITLV